MTRTEQLQRQVGDLWKQAAGQLEDVRSLIARGTERIEADLTRLGRERDRLLRRLGEQTYKLAKDGRLPMPAIVRATVDRLSRVLESMVAAQPKRGGRKGTHKKSPARRAPRRKVMEARPQGG